jgi:hypothetical protein
VVVAFETAPYSILHGVTTIDDTHRTQASQLFLKSLWKRVCSGSRQIEIEITDSENRELRTENRFRDQKSEL